jgi:hypothetical protein
MFVHKTLTCLQNLFAVEFKVTVFLVFNINIKKVVCSRRGFTGELNRRNLHSEYVKAKETAQLEIECYIYF